LALAVLVALGTQAPYLQLALNQEQLSDAMAPPMGKQVAVADLA
jgi:hypothetical protein